MPPTTLNSEEPLSRTGFLSRRVFPIQDSNPHSFSADASVVEHKRPRASNGNPGFEMGGDGGNRTPVQWPAPNSSPSAVYGFISQPPALRRHTAR